MPRIVKVSVPATIANFGPGFDVFGLALAQPSDTIEARKSDIPGIRITGISGTNAEDIPKETEKNTAGIAATKVVESLGCDQGVELKIEKGIKVKGGIGSSGASAVAGAVAINELFDGGLSDKQLIEAAATAEKEIAGSIHYDNVTAAVVGGFIIVTSIDPLEFLKLETPRMRIVVAQPTIEIPTAFSRGLLPKKVPLGMAVANIGRASTMAAALKAGDLGILGKCMVDDLVEPIRAKFIPGFSDVKHSALKAGAVGAAIAGSGPSIFAIVKPNVDAEPVAQAMREAFERAGVGCETIITSPGDGARVIEKR